MTTDMIEAFENPEALAQGAAAAIAQALDEALQARGRALFIATGGHTPGAAYDRLSTAPLDWAKVTVTLSDERWVEVDDPDSNERLLRERLLRGPAQAARLISLRGDAPTPEAAAHEAGARLAALPPADILLLGMGEDGHVASLFPGNPALSLGLAAEAPPCIPVPRGEGGPPPQARLSLSVPVLAAARQAIVLISGQAKRAVIERALAGSDARDLPVRAVLQRAPRVRLMWSA